MTSNMSRQMFFLGEGLVACIAFAILSCSNPTHHVGVGRKSGLPGSGGVNEPERYPRQDIQEDPSANDKVNGRNR
jgi:hypothetical protein